MHATMEIKGLSDGRRTSPLPSRHQKGGAEGEAP